MDINISTLTSSVNIPTDVNMFDVAKYIPINHFIRGVKLKCSNESFMLMRGNPKLSKKKRDFYNQVTMTLLFQDNLYGCKLFQNGTIHITGGKKLSNPVDVLNELLIHLTQLEGLMWIQIQMNLFQSHQLLVGNDNLVYSPQGIIIGWYFPCKKYFKIQLEDVEITHMNLSKHFPNLENPNIPLFMTCLKHNSKPKNLYTLQGQFIGTASIILDRSHSMYKGNLIIKEEIVYQLNRRVGQLLLEFSSDAYEKLQNYQISFAKFYAIQRKKNTLYVLHSYQAFTQPLNNNFRIQFSDLHIHMINTFFQIPLEIQQMNLHKQFLEHGYYSRFDPSSNPGVDWRFFIPFSIQSKLNQNLELTQEETLNLGRCPCDKNLHCSCKIISIRIFKSGKFLLTGFNHPNQMPIVHNFIKNFYNEHEKMFIPRNVIYCL